MILIKNKRIVLPFGFRTWFKNTFTRPNRNALFIFGFQKSGTSVIASLLAKEQGSRLLLILLIFGIHIIIRLFQET